MILTAVGALGGWVLSWAALGFSANSIWWVSLLVPGAWALAIALRRRGALALALFLSVGLAGGVALLGHVVAALAATALALWSWDLGLLWVSRLRRGDADSTRRLARAALMRSTALCAGAFLGGVGFSSTRITIPFWWFVGATLGAWVGLVLIVRGVRSAYGPGGDASGNRSHSSGPTS